MIQLNHGWTRMNTDEGTPTKRLFHRAFRSLNSDRSRPPGWLRSLRRFVCIRVYPRFASAPFPLRERENIGDALDERLLQCRGRATALFRQLGFAAGRDGPRSSPEPELRMFMRIGYRRLPRHECNRDRRRL